MGKEKQEYIPLHKRIQSSKTENKQMLKDMAEKDKEIGDLFKSVFDTHEGQQLLSHLVETYIGHVPAANATPNEIMFQHGRSYVVHDILKKIRRES